ncbi:MAG: plasmid pRiA4b ORF-3 family protein [Calditrichia bacterium]
MAKKIYQIQVALKHYRPKIWRRLLVPSDLFLADLHKIIQTAMGWTNSHLHQFIKDKRFYSKMEPEDELWRSPRIIDYDKNKIRISDLLQAEKEKIIYEYDFGDGWEHDVILEKILPFDENLTYPLCVAGKRHCPPEDCGGPLGYAHMLEVLKNSKHKEYTMFRDWLRDDFDPDYFNIEEVNKFLRQENYGCLEFY